MCWCNDQLQKGPWSSAGCAYPISCQSKTFRQDTSKLWSPSGKVSGVKWTFKAKVQSDLFGNDRQATYSKLIIHQQKTRSNQLCTTLHRWNYHVVQEQRESSKISAYNYKYVASLQISDTVYQSSHSPQGIHLWCFSKSLRQELTVGALRGRVSVAKSISFLKLLELLAEIYWGAINEATKLHNAELRNGSDSLNGQAHLCEILKQLFLIQRSNRLFLHQQQGLSQAHKWPISRVFLQTKSTTLKLLTVTVTCANKYSYNKRRPWTFRNGYVRASICDQNDTTKKSKQKGLLKLLTFLKWL